MSEAELDAALKTIQNLRGSVGLVFEKLVDGVKQVPSQESERQFLSDLSQDLSKVNKNIGDLEKLSTSLTSQGSALSRNASILVLDPTTDKTHLSAQLLHSYKWTNKVQSHAGMVVTLLHGNTLKRTPFSSLGANKRARLKPQIHSVQPEVVDQLIGNIRPKFANMNIELVRPLGTQAVLQITLGRVLKALCVLRGLILEHISVRAYSEDFNLENGQLDIWGKSKYEVFRKVTSHASAAMLHFSLPQHPDTAIHSFLVWLNSYAKLFTVPCQRCSRFLVDQIPPTWRDFKNLEAYHESCRQ